MKKNLLASFTFLILLVFSNNINAEGTKPLSPDSVNITTLIFLSGSGNGSTFGAALEDRIRFVITDHVNENFYFALNIRNGSNTPNTVANAYYRILDNTGTQIGLPVMTSEDLTMQRYWEKYLHLSLLKLGLS